VDIAAFLHRKFQETSAEYQCAKEEYSRLMSIASDTAGVAMRDGNLARRQAMRIQADAWRKYEHALKAFTDYVVYGKLPQILR